MSERHIDCGSDEELDAMLAGLFAQGHEEVEIRHPTEGAVIYTKAKYLRDKGIVKHGSARSYQESKRLERKRKNLQIRHRTAMLGAEIRKINLDDGELGKDSDGNDIDIDGMLLVLVADYLPGIELHPDEVGCFIDEQCLKPPIRLVENKE